MALYRRAIDELEVGKPIEEIRKEIYEVAPWWKEVFCKHSRCKYKTTELS